MKVACGEGRMVYWEYSWCGECWRISLEGDG